MFEIAYKTEEGMKIVQYEGKISVIQPVGNHMLSFNLADGSVLVVSTYNIFYYRIIR